MGTRRHPRLFVPPWPPTATATPTGHHWHGAAGKQDYPEVAGLVLPLPPSLAPDAPCGQSREIAPRPGMILLGLGASGMSESESETVGSVMTVVAVVAVWWAH
jgi:hypothetical protein